MAPNSERRRPKQPKARNWADLTEEVEALRLELTERNDQIQHFQQEREGHLEQIQHFEQEREDHLQLIERLQGQAGQPQLASAVQGAALAPAVQGAALAPPSDNIDQAAE